MKKLFTTIFFFLYFILLQTQFSLAQRVEAEAASLLNGATEKNCTSCSGGAYVDLAKGSLSFEIDLAEEGFYNIEIYAAAPGGDKINIFSLDGTSGDFIIEKNSQYTSLKIVEGYKLAAGEHLVAINSTWGYINIDYIQFTKVQASQRFNLYQELIAPEPIPEASALFNFLLDSYGSKIISGVMTLNSMDMSDWLKEKTGKEPALLGIDFMHSGRGYNWYNDEEPVNDARTWYSRNGIPALMWHWRDPLRVTEEFYADKTSFDVSKIADESSAEYKAMLADIDYIAGLLKQLQENNVPVIWRPLHEAAGGWFWWGAKGPEPLKELWVLMYDRMVNYHGLNNLIWVWTSEPSDDAWYPGDEYVDIVGRDIYKEGDHSSQAIDFYSLNSKFNRKKMIALSEVGSFPDPDKLKEDGAAWSWFMPWYGEHTTSSKHNSLDLWQKTMDHEYVLTLDEMPGLKNYERQNPVEEPEPQLTGIFNSPKESTFTACPTIIVNDLIVRSEKRINNIVVLDVLGKEAMRVKVAGKESVISFSGLKPGIYLIRVDNSRFLRVLKK